MITNFSSCPLGISLAQQLSENIGKEGTLWDKLLLVSPNAEQMGSLPFTQSNPNVMLLNGFLNESEDRNRVIAYMKSENLRI